MLLKYVVFRSMFNCICKLFSYLLLTCLVGCTIYLHAYCFRGFSIWLIHFSKIMWLWYDSCSVDKEIYRISVLLNSTLMSTNLHFHLLAIFPPYGKLWTPLRKQDVVCSTNQDCISLFANSQASKLIQLLIPCLYFLIIQLLTNSAIVDSDNAK